MSVPTLCLYTAGTPSERVQRAHGHFEDWFAPLLAQHDIHVVHFDGRSGFVPPAFDTFDGIVTTGSPLSLTRPEPWMEAAVALIRHAYESNTPVLGVCFGHQLIGAAFGGSVIKNPQGWHLGTEPLEIAKHAADDPLFEGLSTSVYANFSHEDIVDPDTLSPLNGVRVLATSAKADATVVAAGPWIRGVQFHPELTGDITKTVIESRRQLLTDLAQSPADHPDSRLARTVDAPHGAQMLHNFIKHFVVDRHPRRATT